jgi:hypothetical protein
MIFIGGIACVTIIAVSVSSGLKVQRVHKLKTRKNSLMSVEGIDKLLKGGTKRK